MTLVAEPARYGYACKRHIRMQKTGSVLHAQFPKVLSWRCMKMQSECLREVGRMNAQTVGDLREMERRLKEVVKQLLRLLQPVWAIGTPIRTKPGSVDNQFIKQSFERQRGQTIGSADFTTDAGCKGDRKNTRL